ncbi:MAG: DNA repair protein RecO [Acidobacteriota bacterium]|nr:DNA repair protein RecO [Acidobacteriota bacterium]MDW3228885.1 DNA repair protein RecO [Acidobacteriota bacterium]MDY0232297.1 DNA repair protein RecO [Candidatus Saccharicenans sp.]
MPIDQSEAIILRTQNFAEQDKLVVFFSREKGLVRGIAKGARKFNNRFGSSLEPFSVVRIFYYEKERQDLVTISNCDLLESAFELLNDLKVSYAFSYIAELTEKFSPYRAGEELLYRLLLTIIQSARAGQKIEYLTRYFEYWFLKINGILPDFRTCQKCHQKIKQTVWLEPQKDGVLCQRCVSDKKFAISPWLLQAIDWMKKNPPAAEPGVELKPEDWKYLGRVFQSIIIFHLEDRPKTLNYLDF